jgi:hypothetical protein
MVRCTVNPAENEVGVRLTTVKKCHETLQE